MPRDPRDRSRWLTVSEVDDFLSDPAWTPVYRWADENRCERCGVAVALRYWNPDDRSDFDVVDMAGGDQCDDGRYHAMAAERLLVGFRRQGAGRAS